MINRYRRIEDDLLVGRYLIRYVTDGAADVGGVPLDVHQHGRRFRATERQSQDKMDDRLF